MTRWLTVASIGVLLVLPSAVALAQPSIIVQEGFDTTLAEEGLSGPDSPHGQRHPDGPLWEFDLEDPLSGGANHGLIWLDIPFSALARFAEGTAVLSLHVANSGDAGRIHRVTADWLSEPGNNVTWNSMPGGPGIVVGRNALDRPSATFPASVGLQGTIVQVDVSADVRAWAGGAANLGWAFLPTGSNGTEFSSFESDLSQRPKLEIRPGRGSDLLQPGDADQDLDFDQLDLVQVQIAGKYLSGKPATWGEGDWSGAPGGRRGEPPTGDGRFDQFDLILALRHGLYLAGPYAASSGCSSCAAGPTSAPSDGNVVLALNQVSASVFVQPRESRVPGLERLGQGEAYVVIPEPSASSLMQYGVLVLVVCRLLRIGGGSQESGVRARDA